MTSSVGIIILNWMEKYKPCSKPPTSFLFSENSKSHHFGIRYHKSFVSVIFVETARHWPQKTMGISILLGTSLEISATYALYMVGTSNLGCPSENNHKLFAPRSLEPMRAAPARQWPPRQWPPPLAAAPRTRALKPRKAKAGMDHNIRYPSVIH
jgi:hypothetical protein